LWRQCVTVGLWAASAYAALAYFVPAMRFGPLDHAAKDRRFSVGEEFLPTPKAVLDGTTVLMTDPLRGEQVVRLWGVSMDYTPPQLNREATYFLENLLCESPHSAERRQTFGIAPPTVTVLVREGIGVFERDVIVIRGGHLANRVSRDVRRSSKRSVRTYLADVTLRDGTNLGADLVRRGLARWDAQEAPCADHLRRAEEEARAAHRGMWAEMAPARPTAAAPASGITRVEVFREQ
jgi:hypothetical protein